MRRLTVLLLLLTALAICSMAAPAVAVLGGPLTASWNSDVQAKLLATGFFSTVDIINISTTTPTLAQLKNYSAVLVYSDEPGYADATTFGNNLADYVDGGGGVVLAVFAIGANVMSGRFHTADYYAIEPGPSASGTVLTMGTILEAGSPLLTGVSSMNGGTSSFHGTGSLNGSAVGVVNWSNGKPLIARRTIGGRQRVDLNFFPPSNAARADLWLATTDGARIMANALLFTIPGAPTTVPALSAGALAGLAVILMGAGLFLLRPRRV